MVFGRLLARLSVFGLRVGTRAAVKTKDRRLSRCDFSLELRLAKVVADDQMAEWRDGSLFREVFALAIESLESSYRLRPPREPDFTH